MPSGKIKIISFPSKLSSSLPCIVNKEAKNLFINPRKWGIIEVGGAVMLERENKFYKENQAEFREKYLNKWLVIVGESLWGVFDKVSDAGKAALQNFEPDAEFMIHRPADDNTVIEWPIISVIRPNDDYEEGINPVMTASKGEMKAFQYPH